MPGATMTSRSKPLILLVDDDADLVEATADFLAVNGFDVVTADDGAIGLDLAVQQLPDLMLVDLALPGLDGLEVVRRMKAMATTSRIPVIAFTGHAGGPGFTFERETRAAGFDAVITKPGKPDELVLTVRRMITEGCD